MSEEFDECLDTLFLTIPQESFGSCEFSDTVETRPEHFC